jgi:hypothetical protein
MNEPLANPIPQHCTHGTRYRRRPTADHQYVAVATTSGGRVNAAHSHRRNVAMSRPLTPISAGYGIAHISWRGTLRYTTATAAMAEAANADECPICLGTERARCTLLCLHHACFECMLRALDSNPQCPVCRQDVNIDAVRRRGPDTRANRRRGTFWGRARAQRKRKEAPRAECPMEGCGQVLLARNVARHLDTVHLQYRCVWCDGAVEVRHRAQHEPQCRRTTGSTGHGRPTRNNPFPHGVARCTCAERAHIQRNGACWGCNVRAAVARSRKRRRGWASAIDLT